MQGRFVPRRFTISMALSLLFILTPLAVSSAAPALQDEGDAYTVQSGDWLITLAQEFYDDPLAWPTIWVATNAKAQEDNSYTAIVDPNLIEIGQKLWIPSAPTITILRIHLLCPMFFRRGVKNLYAFR